MTPNALLGRADDGCGRDRWSVAVAATAGMGNPADEKGDKEEQSLVRLECAPARGFSMKPTPLPPHHSFTLSVIAYLSSGRIRGGGRTP